MPGDLPGEVVIATGGRQGIGQTIVGDGSSTLSESQPVMGGFYAEGT